MLILNRAPTKTLKGKTSFEAWYGHKPSMSFLRTFGCIGHVRNTKSVLTKLEDRSTSMVFLGYAEGTKAYRLYNPRGNKVLVSRDFVLEHGGSWQLHQHLRRRALGHPRWWRRWGRGAEHFSGRAEHSWGSVEHSWRSAEHSWRNAEHARSGAERFCIGGDHYRTGAEHSRGRAKTSSSDADHSKTEVEHSYSGAEHCRSSDELSRSSAEHCNQGAEHSRCCAKHSSRTGNSVNTD